MKLYDYAKTIYTVVSIFVIGLCVSLFACDSQDLENTCVFSILFAISALVGFNVFLVLWYNIWMRCVKRDEGEEEREYLGLVI